MKNVQELLTKGNKKVSGGRPAAKPTRPEAVTPATPLEELNLNWQEADLPERERTKHVHRLHPYLANLSRSWWKYF